MRGICKWFDKKKGYGFIQVDNHPDVFIHYSDIVGKGYRKLEDGEIVEFDADKTDKGEKARNLKIVGVNPKASVEEKPEKAEDRSEENSEEKSKDEQK